MLFIPSYMDSRKWFQKEEKERKVKEEEDRLKKLQQQQQQQKQQQQQLYNKHMLNVSVSAGTFIH